MPVKRKCKAPDCSNYFPGGKDVPQYVQWCSPQCQEKLALHKLSQVRKERERAERKAKNAAFKKLKREHRQNDRRIRREAAIREFNRYIRLRDKDKPCISCGARAGTYKLTCGHFITAGSCSALRFDPRNAHGQCWWNCNRNKSGNITGYRKGLLERFGQEEGAKLLEFLEGPQPTINITAEWYREIEQTYKEKCREIENAQPN